MNSTQEVSLGRVTVWNLDKLADKYLPDKAERKQVITLLSANKRKKETLKGMGVIAVDGKSIFSGIDQEIGSLIDEAKNLLFLGILASNVTFNRHANSGHYMRTAENCTVVFQAFDGSDYTSESTGAIVRFSIGGYKIGEITYPIPSYVPSPTDFRYDQQLLDDLLRFKALRVRRFRQLMQAADAMSDAYHNDNYVSHNSRILSQARSLEILFKLPATGQRATLKSRVERLIDLPGEKKLSYWYESWDRKLKKQVKVREVRSCKVKWADRFYVLRNKIIHGDPILPGDYNFENKHRHIDIAPLFFILGIKKELDRAFRRERYFDQIEWTKHPDGITDYEGFFYDNRELYRACHLAALEMYKQLKKQAPHNPVP